MGSIIRLSRGSLRNLVGEVKLHPRIYFLLTVLLLSAFFVRVYKIDQIMGFYFDQGRDALVIWDFWHKGKLFLVGPTTGIEGILRGPWYYWLIAPFYLISGGDPLGPSIFLSITAVLAILILYKLAKEVSDRQTGILAVIIATFSYYIVLSSRWLSNPTPMLLISMLLVYAFFLVLKGKKIAWVAIGFLLGIAMQFGSAAEVFYFPALVIIFGNIKNLPSKKIILLSILFLIIGFIPQIIFDIRHDGVLKEALKKFFIEEQSFKLSFWEITKIRLPFYFDVFSSKLFPSEQEARKIFGFIFFSGLLFNFKSLWMSDKFRIIFILFISPLIGMLFFQGNYGNVYDYYFTGYYFIFILLFSIVLSSFFKNSFANKILIVIFLIVFLKQNLTLVRNYLFVWTDGPISVNLGTELQAVKWIIGDAKNDNFNVDVYVPPVIPYAYDYLFLWQTTKKCGGNLCGMKKEENVDLLYLLYEIDPPHPERLEAWLERQKKIGVVEKENRFGGVVVQKRSRIDTIR